jgi:hypothetical protein
MGQNEKGPISGLWMHGGEEGSHDEADCNGTSGRA